MNIPDDMIPGEGLLSYIRRKGQTEVYKPGSLTIKDIEKAFNTIDKKQQEYYTQQKLYLEYILANYTNNEDKSK
jgi:hypothetical protein